MRRFGLITYGLRRFTTGIGHYTVGLISAFDRLGVPVKLMHAGRPSDSLDGINLPGSGLLPGLLTLGQLEIGWHARHLGLDLVHDPTGTAPLALCPARRVVTLHDVFPHVRPQTSTALERLIYRTWLPVVLRSVDAVITVSRQSQMDILHHLPVQMEKIMVIPEAAGRHFRPLPEAEARPALERAGIRLPYILYIGSIEPRKNLVRLVQAYAALRERSPGWELVIVGARNFWKSTPVVEAVEQLDLKEHVHFTGYIPDEDLPAMYSQARLFVFPSLYEGFGLPVLEAMACGTPVITSNTTSLPEVAGEAALLVDPLDVQAIAAAMERILCDPDLAAELRARGLERASQFSWERTARETLAVYERVLDGNTGTK